MNVPFVDLKAQYASIAPDVNAAMDEVVQSAAFILGPAVRRFESHFAQYVGSPYCVGVESGTAALKVALEALGVGPGDEVILPANTYIASAIAVSAVGATPVLVEADEAYLIDATAVEAAVGPRTKAIMPVHLYGQAVDLEPLLAIARRHGLKIIEDASQAHGAVTRERRVGSIGDVGCFSFYPGKNLGAYGDGGAVVTANVEIAERVKLIRDFGQKKKYEHEIKGDNCRLDSLQAAVLDVKLRHLDDWNERRRNHAERYDRLLSEAGFPVPVNRGREGHVHHLYVTQVPNRAEVQRRLEERGVQTGIHYPIPIHRQPAYADLGYAEGTFPKTEAHAQRILSLPMFAEMQPEQIEYVVASLVDAVSSTRATAIA